MQNLRDEFVDLKERNSKKVSIYEKTTVQVDGSTGEVLKETSEKVVKTSKEPDFIKVYYETMLAFNKIDNIPISFVLSLSKFIEWTNEGKPMVVTINKRVRDILQQDCNVKLAQINRYIKTSVDSGLMFKTEYRGVFELNPFFIAKGKWDSIQKLQCKFNFIDGKWIREIEDTDAEQNVAKNE